MTIYQNTTLAMLEKPENLPSPGAVIASAGQEEVPKKKQEVLLDLVEKNGGDLTGDQKDKFYTLLINYSSVFATTDLELGKTNKLRHQIETGNAIPICQAVCRIFPVHTEEVRGLLQTDAGERCHPTVLQPLNITDSPSQEKGWNHKILRGLLQTQQCHKERCISPPQN